MAQDTIVQSRLWQCGPHWGPRIPSRTHRARILTAASGLCLKLTGLSKFGGLWEINCFPIRPLWGVPSKTKVHVNRHVTTDLQMADKHMERWSTSLAVGEMQIKITLRYYYTPIRMAKMKNNDNTKPWQNVEKLDHSYFAVGNGKWYSHSGRQFSK